MNSEAKNIIGIQINTVYKRKAIVFLFKKKKIRVASVFVTRKGQNHTTA